MACANGVGWCKGVGGFGNLCTACQKGGVKPAGGVVAPSLPGFKMPVAKVVAMPALGGIPALPMGGAAAAVVVAPLVLGPPRQVTVYRGDTREPGELKKLGFELWGEAIANVSKVGGIANYILMKCRELKTGATFADFVRVGKDQGRPTISTSANQGCG
jgi:hypothetical protein